MNNKTELPWYDSPWLSAYLQAKAILAEISPEKLRKFEAEMQVFLTPLEFKVKHMKNFLSEELQGEIIDLIATLPDDLIERHEFIRMGRLVVHNHPRFNQLQEEYTDFVSDSLGEAVEPAYNFLSLYNNLGVCEPHMDAPSAKWTLDLCVRQSAPWPIHISQVVPWPEAPSQARGDWQSAIKRHPETRFIPFVMEERDALLFAGSSQWHYRERIPRVANQNFCHLVFFHYIPKGAAELHCPHKWAQLFDVRELDVLENWREAVLTPEGAGQGDS